MYLGNISSPELEACKKYSIPSSVVEPTDEHMCLEIASSGDVSLTIHAHVFLKVNLKFKVIIDSIFSKDEHKSLILKGQQSRGTSLHARVLSSPKDHFRLWWRSVPVV